jgi:PAS domain S-box-containing protein
MMGARASREGAVVAVVTIVVVRLLPRPFPMGRDPRPSGPFGRQERLVNAPRVIFALEDEADKSTIAAESASWGFAKVLFPKDLPEVESLFSSDSADVIVTDFYFHSGAFADWLTLWPLPAILIVDARDDSERIARTIRDESSLFLERDAAGVWLGRLPVLVRKVCNIRESLQRQNAHLKMTEHQYLNLLQAVPDIVYTLDSEGRFLYLNDSIRSLGFEPAKLIGKHFSEIIHPADVPKVSRTAVLRELEGTATGPEGAPKLFDERRSGQRMTRNLELRLRRNTQGEGYLYASVNAYGEVSSAGWMLPEYENRGQGTVGIIRDITVRKEHELELEKALAAREILLRETHHRVKNNLQVVSSLLNLQETMVHDDAARTVFLECQTQIQSMAMVHEVLYRSGNFDRVEMQAYLDRLEDYLSSVYDTAFRGITCSAMAEGISLGLDEAIPVGLIVNELLSNAFKHAFPGGRRGTVTLTLAETDGFYELVVSDDGVGFEATHKEDREEGLGTELVHALASQLRGELVRTSRNGARILLRFPKRD